MQLVETPRDRLRNVTIGLFAHRSGPNVLAGVFAGALLQWLSPSSWTFVLLTLAAWAVSVVVYAIVDEVKQTIDEQQRRRDNPWLLEPDSAPRGIE